MNVDEIVKMLMNMRHELRLMLEDVDKVIAHFNIPQLEFTLPDEFRDLVTVEHTIDGIVVRPKKFLGKEMFARLSAFVRDVGGEYISAGRESRFFIPKKAEAK